MIAAVTKRRIVTKYISLFKKRGYEIPDLNFVNPLESVIIEALLLSTDNQCSRHNNSLLFCQAMKFKAESLFNVYARLAFDK